MTTWESDDRRAVLFNCDCLDAMRGLAENSVEAIVTDPPAGIAFMNAKWDSDKGGRDHWIAWMQEVAAECLRVVKPGGHALVWSLPRTSHWTAMAWENASWEPRDRISHITGSGFPKSLSISKAFDRAAGVEREVIGTKVGKPGYSTTNGEAGGYSMQGNVDGSLRNGVKECEITAPATDLAKQWDGWGTALKPAVEDWWLFRKPIEKGLSIAENVARWGCGALNIGASRVGTSSTPRKDPMNGNLTNAHMEMRPWMKRRIEAGEPLKGDFDGNQGRWPANLIISYPADTYDESGTPLPNPVKEEVLKGFPVTTSGKQSASGHVRNSDKHRNAYAPFEGQRCEGDVLYGDSGSAARFFQHCPYTEADYEAALRYVYVPKESDREIQPAEDFPLWGEKHEAVANKHPTLKPLALMRYLVKLVTPPGGTVLDPFSGSATTGVAAVEEGFNFVGCESDTEHGYFKMAIERLSKATLTPASG